MGKTLQLLSSDLYPHYSNPKFSRGQTKTVWIANNYAINKMSYDNTVDGCNYIYSDRLSYDDRKRGIEVANLSGYTKHTAYWHELFLRETLNNQNIELIHIVSGVNVSNGYPYLIYGIKGD